MKKTKTRNKHLNKKDVRRKPSSVLLLVISIIIGLTYTSVTAKPNTEMAEIQAGIAEKIIRFHVIANSDSSKDQALKLQVKEAVVNYTKSILENSKSIQESESILLAEQETIIAIAKNVILQNGYDYNVTAELTDTYFPTKSYGTYTFPPGTYRAFQIKIGEAKGQNWWCVLYPPLCFIDISYGVVDNSSETLLKETLTTEEFNAVSEGCDVKYRFKYLTFLNRFMP
ncbi:MAG: stage II sporulation protein R [Lachnospiraceae bacterium]|nr:stage II sporulation protein R [Lachnospiraceae bacterium]